MVHRVVLMRFVGSVHVSVRAIDRSCQPPFFPPRHALVVGRQHDEPVQRKRRCVLTREKCKQARHVGVMARQHDVPRFSTQPLMDPRGRVVGLKIPGRGELREWIASPPERFGSLFRA